MKIYLAVRKKFNICNIFAKILVMSHEQCQDIKSITQTYLSSFLVI